MLPMHVAAQFDGCVDFYEHGLRHENFAGFHNKETHFGFRKLLVSEGLLATAFVQQFIDNGVDVEAAVSRCR